MIANAGAPILIVNISQKYEVAKRIESEKMSESLTSCLSHAVQAFRLRGLFVGAWITD